MLGEEEWMEFIITGRKKKKDVHKTTAEVGPPVTADQHVRQQLLAGVPRSQTGFLLNLLNDETLK